jgi:hypothetical protein
MDREQVFQKHIVHTFDHPTFLGAPASIRPYPKVNGYSVDVEIHTTETPFLFTLSKFVQVVLREIGSSNTQTFIRPKARNG